MQGKWERVGIGWNRAILEAVFSAINVPKVTRARKRFDPERVAFVWRA
jgi:hypothetical protein